MMAVAALCSSAPVYAQQKNSIEAVVHAANDFIATLSADQKQKVMYSFGDVTQRAKRSNFPTGFVPRGGISLKQMSVPQQQAAMKLMGTLLVQEFSETGVELLGPYGALMNDPHAPFDGRWARQYLGDRAMTIAGGTSEVQRNIVAQRVLGLPRR